MYIHMILKITLIKISWLKYILYLRNLKYAHLTPIFRLNNIHFEFSTCQYKLKRFLCNEKPVLNESKMSDICTNINDYQICIEKDKKNRMKWLKLPTPHEFLAYNSFSKQIIKFNKIFINWNKFEPEIKSKSKESTLFIKLLFLTKRDLDWNRKLQKNI